MPGVVMILRKSLQKSKNKSIIYFLRLLEQDAATLKKFRLHGAQAIVTKRVRYLIVSKGCSTTAKF